MGLAVLGETRKTIKKIRRYFLFANISPMQVNYCEDTYVLRSFADNNFNDTV